ncbi:hypothetical protein ACN1C3_27310 [Pseudomonas sp. H11T01]|uniref:hypothetical protein n=1 Tax=Pseudomonas sp. H11T01 TaxID=3402749 RepID=UPI003AD728AA
MEISESDWKKFKSLRLLALDRFCQGVLGDAETISQHNALSAHARYGMLYDLVHNRNKDMVRAFDYFSRSSAVMSLRFMVMYNLLTDAELSVLSEDTLRDLKSVVRQPYELKWVEEIVRQE